jgi:hypothetical protein
MDDDPLASNNDEAEAAQMQIYWQARHIVALT